MVEAVQEYGLPYITAHSTLASMTEVLAPTYRNNQNASYGYPVLLWLQGRDSEALDALDNVVESLGEREDIAAEELREFTVGLSQRIRARG